MPTYSTVVADDGTWSVPLPDLPGGAYDLAVWQATCALVSRPVRAVLLVAPVTAILGAPEIVTAWSEPPIVVSGRPGLSVDVVIVSDTDEIVVEAAVILDGAGLATVATGELAPGHYTVRAQGRTEVALGPWVEAALTITALGVLSTDDDLSIATEEDDIVLV